MSQLPWQKAIKTKREKYRGSLSKAQMQKKYGYNRPKKNEVRDDIVKLVKETLKPGSVILTLESPQWLFVNKLPTHRFIIPQFFQDRKNRKIFDAMLKTKPENVLLFPGNASDLSGSLGTLHCIYLDFCCGYETAGATISKLRGELIKSSIFGFTFCLRGYKKSENLDAYKLKLYSDIQLLLNLPLRIVYCKSYRDKQCPGMVTLFFSHVKSAATPLSQNTQDEANWFSTSSDSTAYFLSFILAGSARHRIYLCLSNGVKSQSMVSKELGMRFSHISRSLKQLVGKGLVDCVRSKGSGIRKLYRLTPLGNKLVKKVRNYSID